MTGHFPLLLVSLMASISFFSGALEERIRITYDDGRVLTFTTEHQNTVNMDLRNLEDPERIVSIEHNHFRSTDPSRSDKWILDYLRERGFQGRFIIWLTKIDRGREKMPEGEA